MYVLTLNPERFFAEQPFMRHMTHSMMRENERCRGERQLARVRFSTNLSGRPAGRPCDIAIFGTAQLMMSLRQRMTSNSTILLVTT
jgi:hypothetical protein